MPDIGGLPPAVLIGSGVYLIAQKPETWSNFVLGLVLISVGCCTHIYYIIFKNKK